MDSQQIRLNKFLAERLGISRREADELIAAGKVTIDGQKATLGARIDLGDNSSAEPTRRPEIRCNGKVVPYQADYVYLAFHKPVGYVCSRRAQGLAPTLYDLLPPEYRKLKTVGRLDKDSSGLILLTNDGDFAYQMTHPKFRKTKVYEVELDKPLEPLHQQMISDFGVQLDDGPSKFKVIRAGNEPGIPLSRAFRSAAARDLAPAARGDGPAGRGPRKTVAQARYLVFLSEGRNRQIRRTFAALGYEVTGLHRTAFGPFELSGLKPGKYAIIKP